MNKGSNLRRWTEKQVQAAIEKALEGAPAGPNKEYWTTPGCTVSDIKVKYGLKRFKPEQLKITLVRECCGEEWLHTVANKMKALAIKDPRCLKPRCLLRGAFMPFGKFKGLAVTEIYEQQPSYLAWFHETVDGWEEIKTAIRALDGIEEHLEAYRQPQQQPVRQPTNRVTPTRQQIEWLIGKFSSRTVDDVCVRLFCEEDG
jgi:hypothetical protein